MLHPTRTFRVFMSSTFNNLKAERNALQERVYPHLRELFQQHDAQFQPIDLRWGVSGEASFDQQTMNICLGEIARCQQTYPVAKNMLGKEMNRLNPDCQTPLKINVFMARSVKSKEKKKGFWKR